MLNFKVFKPKSDFQYWFLRKGQSTEFAIMSEDKHIGEYNIYDTDIKLHDDVDAEDSEQILKDIISDFVEFTKRPEFIIGLKIPDALLTDTPIAADRRNEMKSYCEQLIRGCCYMMYANDVLAQKYSDRAIKWLASTDFYDAPASTKYHDSDPSGLLRHTLKVVNRAIDLITIDPFRSINVAEAIIVAITHDWCKINFYESFMRNVKNEDTGVWEQVPSYRHKPSEYPFGHGVTSLYMAEKLFKLTLEQALAIRWHMDIYDVSDYEKSDLFDAKEKYPMVRLLQMADQLSIL